MIKTSRNELYFKNGDQINEHELLEMLNPELILDGKKVDTIFYIDFGNLPIDKTQSDPDRESSDPKQYLYKTGDYEITLNARPNNQRSELDYNKQIKIHVVEANKQTKNQKKLVIGLIIVVFAIALIGLGISHHNQTANNQQQSSSIAQNSSSINDLSSKADSLSSQLSSAQSANDASQNKLASEYSSTKSDLESANSNMQSEIGDLKNNQNSLTQQIQSLYQTIINYFSNLGGNH